MSNTQLFDYLLKYIIVGDSGVGKSMLLLSYIQKRFKEEHEVTIGVEFGSKNIKVKEKLFKIQIWDTAGQEQFRSITRAYYKSSACAFVVYDITCIESFHNVSSWVEECRNQCPKSTCLYLIGNKIDLIDRRIVSYDEGKELADKYNMIFFETSAKEMMNIDEVFMNSVEFIYKRICDGYYDLKNEVS